MRRSGRARPHVPGGTYYLVQLVSARDVLLRKDEDRDVLVAALRRTLSRTDTLAIAYCWLPQALHLAVRCGDISVSRTMQGWTSSYARYLHRSTHELGHVFRQRFQSVLIDPQRWLPELVRFIHYAPVDAKLVTAAEVWPHSSHAVYCNGARAPAWLNTRATFQVLKRRGVADSEAREFLRAVPSSEERQLFAVNGHSDSRVLDVTASSPARPSPSAAPRLTVARIMDLVAQLLDVPLAGITSTSRRHDLSLARSVIAWQVIERRLTSLTGIAAILRRDPSTLSKAIARHRRLQPHLFRLDALRTLQPLR